MAAGFCLLAGFALARYLPNGSLDPTFGGDGKVTTDVGANAHGASALQPDGKIVAAGESTIGFALARYLSNGSLDPTFSGGGKVFTDFGGGTLSVLSLSSPITAGLEWWQE